MKGHVAILGGPNLSLLGTREPQTYGATTWAELERLCAEWSAQLDCRITFLQSDSEGDLVEAIAHWGRKADAIVLNAAAYTHTSVALRDAVAAVDVPLVEIHLTNPDAREEFRRRNLLRDVATAGVHGFGVEGYRLGLIGAVGLIERGGAHDAGAEPGAGDAG